MSTNSDDHINFKISNFENKLSLSVREIFEDGQYFDCVIFGKNEGKVQAHRLILVTAIPGLKTILDNTGKHFGAMFVHRLPLNIETIKKVVKLCYTGEISMTNDELAPLLKFAIDYEVKELIDVCSNRLKQLVDPESIDQIVHQLNYTNDATEQQIWREIICVNFSEVAKYSKFGEISIDQFETILRSSELRNVREEDVFNAFLLWMKNTNNVSADVDIGSILSYIRYPLMNLEFFTENVEKVLEQFSRIDLIAEYYKWRHIQSQQINTHTAMINERMSMRGNELIVLSSNSNSNLLVQIVSSEHGKPVICREIAELQFDKHQCMTCMDDGKLIISGGIDANKNTQTKVTGFDLETMKYIKYPALQIPRSSHASAVIDSDIYIAGGDWSTLAINSVEKYSHKHKKWSFVKSMIQKRVDFSLVVLNSNIYALGGHLYGNGATLNSVECYNPSSDTWTAVAPMAHPRARLSAVVHNNSIYVFGGGQQVKTVEKVAIFSDFTDKVEQYNVTTNSWSTIFTMDTARVDIVSCPYGGYILFMGGHEEEKEEKAKAIQVFNTDKLECIFMNVLPDCTCVYAAFVSSKDLIDKLQEQL